MRSQIVTASKRNTRFLPYAFTEHGAVMLASVLNSPTSIQGIIHVVRAFVRLRRMATTNREMARKLHELERKVENHEDRIQNLFEMFQGYEAEPDDPPPQIGFRPD